MADGNDKRGGKRKDETAELTLGDLDFAEEPMSEELDELDVVEDERPPPPPKPGLGRPGKPRKRSQRVQTLGAAVKGGSEAPPPPPRSVAPPPPKQRSSTSVPPPAPRPKSVAPPPPTKKDPSTPAAKRDASAPGAAPSSDAFIFSLTQEPPKPAAPRAIDATTPDPAPPVAATLPDEPPARKPAEAKPAAPIAKPAAPRPPERAPETDTSPAELRALCERELADKPEPERRARLAYELGRLFEVELGDPQKAAEHYQDALRAAPDHAAAIRGARRTLAATGRHAALPALFDAEIEITREPPARARLLYAKARVMEEHLRQATQALAVYREALLLDPGNLAVLKAIERGHRRDKAWGPLAETYGELAKAVEDPALRAAWTATRAHITETQLKDPTQAAALYEAALDADPHTTTALSSVKRLGTAQQRWPQLVAALRREHDLTQDRRARVEILAMIARIEERQLGDAESAVATLEEAIAASPEERGLLTELARLHRQTGRHLKEVEALSRLVERSDDPIRRATDALRIAQVYEQHLDDLDRARPWLERALEDDPQSRAAGLALARIHEKQGRWKDVVAVLGKRAEATVSVRARADLHFRIGTLLETQLDDDAGAVEQHTRALALEPTHRDAFAALARLHAASKSWRALAELYERAIDRAAHDEEAIAWLFRLGAILEDRLDDPAGALAAYERVLERAPKHLGALFSAERAAERAGEHARLVALLEREAKLEKSPERVADLLHRAAVVTAEGLDDPGSAARMLEQNLKAAPKHRASLETLGTLLHDAGRWLELVAVYGRLVPLTSTEEEKVRLHYRIGEIQETQLGKPEAALESYGLALRLDRDFLPARDAMRSALERAGAWGELVKMLEARLPQLEGVERARFATEIGAIHEERLGKRDDALAAYERAIEAAPAHRPALDARERLLTEARDWSRLTEALEGEVEASTDPFLKTQAALRAAFVRSEQQGAVAPALDAFRPVFAENPEHVGALLAVEEIYARTRDDAGLAVTYEKMAAVVRDPRAKLAALQELARARAASGGDAADVERRVLMLAPDDASALEALATAAAARGDHKTELAMQARLASTAKDPTVGAYHQCRVGEILLADEDAAGALAAFRAALGLDPRSISATRGLTRAARVAEDAEALRQAARHEAEVTRDRAVAVGLHLEAGLLRRRAEQLEEAATDYASALALDPDHEDAAVGLRSMLISIDAIDRLAELLTRAATAAKSAARKAALHLDVAQLHADFSEDMGAAIAAVERALVARADDPVGLSRLAAYLERSGQWQRAVETLERLIPKAKEEALVDAHLRLARMAEQHLGDADRAARSLRAVLAREEDREEALAALVRLERQQGRDEEALRLAKRLVEVVTDPSHRADALAEIAELEKKRGDAAAATAAAFEAASVQGPSGKAARVYKALIESAPTHASWDQYTSAMMAYLDRARAEGVDRSAAYRELAKVFTEAHNRPDRAIATLREGVEACPGDVGISLALVDALKKLKADDKAAAEVRRLLAVDVTAAPAWRALADLFRASGEPDGAAVAFAPLVALKEAGDAEKRTVAGRKPRVAAAPPGILAEAGLKQIVERAALDSPATTLLKAMADVFAKLEGFEHEEWGVTKRDRVRQGDPHPVRAFADRVGTIFGVPEYELYMVDAHGLDRAVVLPGSPPALLVAKSIEGASDAELAFHLARPLALLSRYVHSLDVVPDEDLARVLVAAARHFELSVDVPGLTESEEETRRVGKAIGFFSRGRIQDAATAFAESPPTDLFGWIADLRHMAARAALLVSDDLLAALAAHGGALGADPLADDLALFWASDPAMRFRRAIAAQMM